MGKKNVIYGTIASVLLLVLYFTILTAVESFQHAVDQFFQYWYLFSALIVGFGLQMSLYFYTKDSIKAKAAKTEIAATGGMTAGSMILCCLHHVTDVLPILGLSAASIFLAQYQVPFIVLGIFSNLVGIVFMLNIIQKHGIHSKRGFMSKIFRYDMEVVRNSAIALSAIVVILVFVVSGMGLDFSSTVTTTSFAATSGTGSSGLVTKTNDANGLSIAVTPIEFSIDSPVKFSLSLNTHQGSQDYDMTKVSFLEDGNGNIYDAVSWDGTPPGGHHRNGILTFPQLEGDTDQIKLIIKDVYDTPERVFIWELA